MDGVVYLSHHSKNERSLNKPLKTPWHLMNHGICFRSAGADACFMPACGAFCLRNDEEVMGMLSSAQCWFCWQLAVYLFGSGLRRRGKTSAAPWGRLVCGWRPALMRWKGCWIASQILQLWRLQCTDEINSGACRRGGLLPTDA